MARPLNRFETFLSLVRMYWPYARPYGKQRDIIHSVLYNYETVVVAGNQLGKDWVAALLALMFFKYPWLFFEDEWVDAIERQRQPGMPDYLLHHRRVITTSVAEKHLKVLWAEIGGFITTSSVPLIYQKGGPLVVNDKEIRLREEKIAAAGNVKNYLVGQVSERGEGLQGHHAPYNFAIIDEASGVADVVRDMLKYMKKILVFGNPLPCQNFFYKSVREGDLVA